MGSKRIGRRADGRPVILDQKDGALRAWQEQLRASMRLCAPPTPLLGPVSVHLTIYIARPLSHYGTGRNAGRLKPNAPLWAVTGRDADKVARATGDVGSGCWWRDDRQLVKWYIEKLYDARPRVIVVAEELPTDGRMRMGGRP